MTLDAAWVLFAAAALLCLVMSHRTGSKRWAKYGIYFAIATVACDMLGKWLKS